MKSGHIRIGQVVGLGAALDIPLGFVPRYVQLFNVSDGNLITQAFLQWVIPFSAGNAVISPGDKIKGATSKAQAIVEEVLLASGTFAAGTAAGFLTVLEGSLSGTFGAESIGNANVTANVVHNVASTAVAGAAPATGTSALSRLEGVAGASGAGFTIGSVIAPAGKLLRYVACQGE